MHNKQPSMPLLSVSAAPHIHEKTERWTSPIYNVQFAQIETVPTNDPDTPDVESAFELSAWGISRGLHSLLQDYTQRQIYDATLWLITQQNKLVADVLHRMDRPGSDLNMPLEKLFISIPNEIYLPRGLRMIVTCVTNIVPHNGDDPPQLDKFVAILDPGEARTYIKERKQPHPIDVSNRTH